MRPVVQLLGVPCVQRAGIASPAIRGHKAWGLMAYLALHPGAVSRQRLDVAVLARGR